VKKAFLLVGVILDIVVISLILITALNVINITSSTNSFIADNKFDFLHKQARKTLDGISRYVDFYSAKNTIGSKALIKDSDKYITISIEPFSYKKENSVFVADTSETNSTSRINKIIVNVVDKDGHNILSIDKLIFN